MRRIVRPIVRIGAVAMLVTLAVLVMAGWRQARSDPVVRHADFVTYRLPRGTRPLHLALVSDIHVGNLAMPASRLDRIVDRINAQHPDAVLIAGDLVNGNRPDSRDFHPWMIVKPLSRLRAPLGLYAVLGNHDANTAPATVDAALRLAGVTALHDNAARVGSISLIGLDVYGLTQQRLDRAVAQARALGGVPVMMIHIPPYPALVPRSVPLVLTGHTHCGQIVFPGWDNSFNVLNWRPRYDPQYRCGLVHGHRFAAIITAGLGAASNIPLRINAPPDFWMVTIRGPD